MTNPLAGEGAPLSFLRGRLRRLRWLAAALRILALLALGELLAAWLGPAEAWEGRLRLLTWIAILLGSCSWALQRGRLLQWLQRFDQRWGPGTAAALLQAAERPGQPELVQGLDQSLRTWEESLR